MTTRPGPAPPDLAERGQAVHRRHLDVEGDHVRAQRVQLLERVQAVAAWPTTSMPGSACRIWVTILRMKAESSTTRTRIGSPSWGGGAVVRLDHRGA
jgi:hypothetical protein